MIAMYIKLLVFGRYTVFITLKIIYSRVMTSVYINQCGERVPKIYRLTSMFLVPKNCRHNRFLDQI